VGSGLLTPGHLVILAVIALLVFGPKRLPELGRSLGSGMRGFKRAIEGEDEGTDEGVEAGSEAARQLPADDRTGGEAQPR
jgi:sec-independent protein translocase protein TatA